MRRLLLMLVLSLAFAGVMLSAVPTQHVAAAAAGQPEATASYDYDGSVGSNAHATVRAIDPAMQSVSAPLDGPAYAYGPPSNLVATNEIRVATGLTTKSGARQALGQLDLTAEQLAAANRAIGRATTSSSIDVVQRGSDVIVRISRPGADGFQVFEHVVSPSGAKSVLQTAYDPAGNLVHYDPKTP